MNTVLFACVRNAGRSQMAAGWFNLLSDATRVRALSAGTDPGLRVHPEVVTAMAEVGVDLSQAPTSRLTPELAQRAKLLITMGCGEQCPVIPGLKRDDRPLEIPRANLSLGSGRFVTRFGNASRRSSSAKGGVKRLVDE
jgi:arsenate reductase